MRYLGGKAKIAKNLLSFLNLQISENQNYYEPFCGAGWVFSGVKSNRIYASDYHKDLVLLWQALKGGWTPPDFLSREEYLNLKAGEASALRAFAGFGCSFGGKWFGGYASDSSGRNYCKNAKNSLLNKLDNIEKVSFSCQSYSSVEVERGSLVYCDPPYANTTGYASTDFNTQEFWNWVRQVSEHSKVYVSEYAAPDDFKCVWHQETKMDMHTNAESSLRIEKVFSL